MVFVQPNNTSKDCRDKEIGMESREIRTIRSIKWEEAKGKLMAIMHTYWDDDNYNKMKSLTDQYIKSVEDDGLTD